MLPQSRSAISHPTIAASLLRRTANSITRSWTPGREQAQPFRTIRPTIAFANKPHPTECDVNRARYLVVYVVGIDERFHGVVNAASATGERYAESVFRALEEVFARQKADCVGLYLMVRSSNARAIGFYKRIGFAVDAGVAAPAASATTDAATVVMRKLLP